MATAKIATVGSKHICPMCSGLVPHLGGNVLTGENNVLINGKPVATTESKCNCNASTPSIIVEGNTNILINGKPIAFVNGSTSHGGTIVTGEENVIISSGNTKITNIDFPVIKRIDKLLNGKKTKEAERKQQAIKERFENQNNQPPQVVNAQWVKEEKIIIKDEIFKKITLQADVINISDGETATLKIQDKNSKEITTLSGIVKNKKVSVVWQIKEENHEL